MTSRTLAVLCGLLATALIIAGIILGPLLFRRRRARGLLASGARLRCHSLPDARRLPADELRSIPGFEDTQTTALTNLLHRRDLDVVTYICDWQTRRAMPGRNMQTIALMRFDSVTFQAFELRPSKRKSTDGITFAGHVEFNRRYHLRFRDPARATPEIFNHDLLRFLERQTLPLSIAASGQWLMVYREGRLVHPEELSVFLGEVHTIAGKIEGTVPAGC